MKPPSNVASRRAYFSLITYPLSLFSLFPAPAPAIILSGKCPRINLRRTSWSPSRVVGM